MLDMLDMPDRHGRPMVGDKRDSLADVQASAKVPRHQGGALGFAPAAAAAAGQSSVLMPLLQIADPGPLPAVPDQLQT